MTCLAGKPIYLQHQLPMLLVRPAGVPNEKMQHGQPAEASLHVTSGNIYGTPSRLRFLWPPFLHGRVWSGLGWSGELLGRGEMATSSRTLHDGSHAHACTASHNMAERLACETRSDPPTSLLRPTSGSKASPDALLRS